MVFSLFSLLLTSLLTAIPIEIDDPADCNWYDKFCCSAAIVEDLSNEFEVLQEENNCGDFLHENNKLTDLLFQGNWVW
jgi:hypothetical protein